MYDLDFYFNLKNPPISQNDISNVIKVNLDNQDYYIKRYYKPGKNFIRYLKPKGKAEYKNLLFFAKHNLNTIDVVDFLKSNLLFDTRACLVTRSLENSCNLYEYYSNHKITKDNFVYLIEYIKILKKLHQELKFIHKDYKLRNVLLSKDKKLYLIDCPNGVCLNLGMFNFIISPIFNRLILSNLAIVYKDLKKVLNRKYLIILYKNYFNLNNLKLDKKHKKNISKIVNLF